MLENVLDDYGVKGEIVSVRPGPVVTMYELEPAPGLKASRVIGLADDIARSMSALSARVSTVPGRQRDRHRTAQ
jgi:S-DNA-T family DNA segregation ATPase FtsK/SpoIIIE